MEALLQDTALLYGLGAGLLAALTALVIGLGLRKLTAERDTLRERLRSGPDDLLFDGLAAEAMEQNLTSAQIKARLDTMIAGQSFGRRLSYQLLQANLPLTVAEYIAIRVGLPLLLAGLAFGIWRTPLALPMPLIIGAIAPSIWIGQRKARRRREFAEQLPETLGMLVGSLRGGFSLVQALRVVSREAREPTRSEFERTGQEIQIGLSLSDALDNLARRVESEDLDLVVTAIKINARVGGNLSEILDNISGTIRERGKLRREVRVITSMQRASALVVGLLPVVLATIIFMINPTYMGRIFQPGWPLLIPATAAFFAATGFFVIQRIADIEV